MEPAQSPPTPSWPLPKAQPSPAIQATPSADPPPVRRRNCELDTHVRVQLSTLKDIAGWSYTQIHERFPHIPLSTIKTSCKRARERNSFETGKRSGRPKVLTESDVEKILLMYKNDPSIPYKDLLDAVDNKCSKAAISRLITSHKNLPKRPIVKKQPVPKTAPPGRIMVRDLDANGVPRQQPVPNAEIWARQSISDHGSLSNDPADPPPPLPLNAKPCGVDK
ncbi:hypothetical protein N7540_002580 [Penicillium herquei]|nr:hypothetical protein N7540_002580 [Penicillium herquei]